MNRLFIILILFGSQIGLADFLQLPLHAAQHGELSFLLLYALFKLVIVLPLLHAELVAGRLHRVTPLELAQETPLIWPKVLVSLLFLAAFLTLASHLHSSSWVLAMTLDSLKGTLTDAVGINSTLYWYELSADRTRLIQLIVMQAMLLFLLGWFAWRGAAMVYAIILPACALFILINLPALISLFTDSQWQWQPLKEEAILVALRYALASSMAGFMIWYLVGSFLPDSLPTGRWVLGVQVFDILLGFTALAVLLPVMESVVLTATDTGQVLQALLQLAITDQGGMRELNAFLSMSTLVGTLDSLPLLLLFSLLYTGQTRRDSLFLALFLAIPLASLLLISSPGQMSLSWYGWPLSTLFMVFSLELVTPILALLIAIWVGWYIRPNQVLKQVNPKTGARYWAWRLSLKFVIPIALALTFARASLGLVQVTAMDILLVVLLLVLVWRVVRWLRAL